MPLLSTKNLEAIQKLGRSSMTVTCSIYKRQPYAHDDSNPFGDDTITYASTAVVVKGWLVPMSAVDFTVDVAQVISSGNFVLRVPVGTSLDPGDKVTIGSNEYYASESTVEQTWPEWITVRLRRIQ